MAANKDPFEEAGRYWDLETLYADLASAKGRRLTPTEKLHLRGLLCGHSPAEIAEQLGKTQRGVETDLCATLYRYVKHLVGKSNGKVDNWRNIGEWLDDAGYKGEEGESSSRNDGMSEKFNITKITFENNQIKIDVFLQITVPLATGVSIQSPGEGEEGE